MDEKTRLMRNLQEASFALVDLNLYLNTHPNDAAALSAFSGYQNYYNEVLNEYVSRYGPIEARQQRGTGTWEWISDPWPWERGN